DHRVSNSLFGLIVIAFTAGAFFAPPFSGLDTLPALGVVLVSLGVLLEDVLIVAVGLIAGVGGILLEVTLGKAAASGIKKLF
ncbi:MAG: exopolysaccharide biosynthesis protein, partial [Actinomycetota bacterium]|nr:exopolysaccharide biosynthesis protein [Actinomycetota bacterium]